MQKVTFANGQEFCHFWGGQTLDKREKPMVYEGVEYRFFCSLIREYNPVRKTTINGREFGLVRYDKATQEVYRSDGPYKIAHYGSGYYVYIPAQWTKDKKPIFGNHAPGTDGKPFSTLRQALEFASI